ncbi:hypothetical protein DPV78_006375 [Talaromyces pinophilus]|nr:hypothetical protein DPV78_006375 [Talaromyces pinophilus]
MEPRCLTENLMSLPPELTAMVLKSLPDFNSLLSAMQTCRDLYSCYQDNEKSIITSVSSTILQNAIRYDRQHGLLGPGLIIQQLIFAIKSACVNRDFILEIFTDAWKYLYAKELEELLIPIAMGLAWSLELDDRKQDAISFLTQINEQRPPFLLSSFKPSLKNYRHTEKPPESPYTFAPLEYLLYKLSKENMHFSAAETEQQLLTYIWHRGEMLEKLPAALISRYGIKFFMTENRLQNGIRIEENSVLVRISSWPRPWPLSSDAEIKDLLKSLRKEKVKKVSTRRNKNISI